MVAEPMSDRSLQPRELADWVLARGSHSVTTAQAAKLLSIPEHHVSSSLARWRQRGHLFSPTKGLWIAIPPEFRSWGAIPAANFVDALMDHLGHEYYVCLLSAAEMHGFAHQRPQVFQVMTPARLRNRAFGRVHLRFVTSAQMAGRAVDLINVATGTVRVSTIEVTALDLVSFPLLSGAMFNVANIIGEMLEEDVLDVRKLVMAAAGYPASTVQRTGWLIDYMGKQVGTDSDTDQLLPLARARVTPTILDSLGSRNGCLDERWNVIVNEIPEVDA